MLVMSVTGRNLMTGACLQRSLLAIHIRLINIEYDMSPALRILVN